MKRGVRQQRATDKGFTETQVLAALRDRYKGPAWGFLNHVRNTTGFSRQVRTADALAMGLWPSRGLELLGFEVKVHRSDWLRELQQPDKAEEIAQYCDRWWIAAPKDIVKPGELPATWGLLVMNGSRLVAVKEAAKLEAKPLSRSFLASILRYALTATGLDTELRDTAVKSHRQGYEAGVESQTTIVKRAVDTRLALEQKVRAFERASGVHIDAYANMQRIGEAVQFVMRGGVSEHRNALSNLHSQAASILRAIEHNLKLTAETERREEIHESFGA